MCRNPLWSGHVFKLIFDNSNHPVGWGRNPLWSVHVFKLTLKVYLRM